jgi:aminopeptidase
MTGLIIVNRKLHMDNEQKKEIEPIERYAGVARRILANSARLRAGESVVILGRADSLPFCEALELECRRLGAYPLVIVGSDAALLASLADPAISDEMLASASPSLVAALSAADLVITTFFERAKPHLFRNIPASRLRAQRQSEEKPSDVIYDGKRRWLGTEFPTPGQADALGCDWQTFENLFWRAMNLDYTTLQEPAQKLARKIRAAREIRLQDARNQTDLWLRAGAGGRIVERDDGVIGAEALYLNLPSGEVCFAPPEDSVFGRAYIEVAYWQGQPVRELELEFEAGKVRALNAASGLALFEDVVRNGGGDAARIGEFGIGLNPAVDRVTGFTLLDEKIIGTCHLALGENRALGGINNSALHWDLVVQNAILTIDGEIVLENGEFKL